MSAAVETSLRRNSIPRNQWPSITEFYRDKDIFITGATGYVGKCLLETILRSLPSKGRMFILMRPKRGKSVQERIADIIDKKVVQCLAPVSVVACNERLLVAILNTGREAGVLLL